MKNWFSKNSISIAFLTVIVSLIFICIIGFLFYKSNNSQSNQLFENITKTGSLGDGFNGLLSPFLFLASIILTFLAFYIQYEANKNVTEQFAIQSFENTYLNMLQMFQNQLNNFDVNIKKFNKDEFGNKNESDFDLREYKGKDFFSNTFRIFLKKRVAFKTEEETLYDLFDKQYNLYQNELGVYFTSLYRILKFVSTREFLNDEQKYEYISILRSHLSEYELWYIAYNIIYGYGRKSNDFIAYCNKYALLKNINRDNNEFFDKKNFTSDIYFKAFNSRNEWNKI